MVRFLLVVLAIGLCECVLPDNTGNVFNDEVTTLLPADIKFHFFDNLVTKIKESKEKDNAVVSKDTTLNVNNQKNETTSANKDRHAVDESDATTIPTPWLREVPGNDSNQGSQRPSSNDGKKTRSHDKNADSSTERGYIFRPTPDLRLNIQESEEGGTYRPRGSHRDGSRKVYTPRRKLESEGEDDNVIYNSSSEEVPKNRNQDRIRGGSRGKKVYTPRHNNPESNEKDGNTDSENTSSNEQGKKRKHGRGGEGTRYLPDSREEDNTHRRHYRKRRPESNKRGGRNERNGHDHHRSHKEDGSCEVKYESHESMEKGRRPDRRDSEERNGNDSGENSREDQYDDGKVLMPDGKYYEITDSSKASTKCRKGVSSTRLITLDPEGKMGNREYNIVYHQMSLTDWRFKILKIQKIENGCLWAKYNYIKRNIGDETNNLGELMLFHGSNGISDVIDFGFDEMNAVTNGRFGSGIYFEKNAYYSNKWAPESFGARQILLSRVITGHSMRSKVPRKYSHPPVGFHSVVNSRNNEYVIYRGGQAYPEYVITYESN